MSSATKSNTSHTHNVLLTLPRTASNLLTHILNLPSQPSIKSHPKSGYHFINAFIYRYTQGLMGKKVDEWSEERKQHVKKMFQESFDAWNEFINEAEREGKGTFLKEHLCFLIDPDYEGQFEPSTINTRPRNPGSLSLFSVSGKGITGNIGTSSVEFTTSPADWTIFPSSFWLTEVRPTFLIRHPLIAFPSLLRTALDTQKEMGVGSSEMLAKSECNYHFHRQLYNFYTSNPSFDSKSYSEDVEYPIILDSDDFSEPAILRKYATAVGLDPSLIRFSWEPANPAELEGTSAIEKRFKDTLLASSGVDPRKLRKVANLDLEDERKMWEREFGEYWANTLENLVKDALPDYEWLREKRLKL